MRRRKDIDWIYDNMTLNAGIMGGTGLVGKLGSTLPSPQSSKIISGMNTLSLVPMLHATGGIFGQLKGLEHQVKKTRR